MEHFTGDLNLLIDDVCHFSFAAGANTEDRMQHSGLTCRGSKRFRAHMPSVLDAAACVP